ncbi:MAG: ABC transporter ATP-binding protein [bacterium]|nr:ABC transporter ATP-binding protein [bacterium]
MIEVNNLTKYYGPTKALDNISFSVEKGEVFGLLGPNGAGKTTTMRILTCYMPATSGSARIAGFDVFEDPMKVKSRIGYLPETPPIYEDMSVLSYLDFVARIKEIEPKKINKKIEEVMETVKIKDVSKRIIGHLSKGYRQRVALAQSLLNDPEVLILDEPTVGLDPKQILEIRELIKQLGEKHTVLLSSHILTEVSQICGRVLIINKGKIIAIDTQEDLIKRVQVREKLFIQVKGSKDILVRVFNEKLSGLKKMDIIKEENGLIDLMIESEMAVDLREPIFRLVVENNMVILELKPVKVSLEEVFLQLTETADRRI